jgi:hypothetical protein
MYRLSSKGATVYFLRQTNLVVDLHQGHVQCLSDRHDVFEKASKKFQAIKVKRFIDLLN